MLTHCDRPGALVSRLESVKVERCNAIAFGYLEWLETGSTPPSGRRKAYEFAIATPFGRDRWKSSRPYFSNPQDESAQLRHSESAKELARRESSAGSWCHELCVN